MLLNMSRRKQPCPQQVQDKIIITTIQDNSMYVDCDAGVNTRELVMSTQKRVKGVATCYNFTSLNGDLKATSRNMISTEENTSGAERESAGANAKFCHYTDENFSMSSENDNKNAEDKNQEIQAPKRESILKAVSESKNDCMKEVYSDVIRGMEARNESRSMLVQSGQGNVFGHGFATSLCDLQQNNVRQSNYAEEHKIREEEVLDDSDRPLCIEEEVEHVPQNESQSVSDNNGVSFVQFRGENTPPQSISPVKEEDHNPMRHLSPPLLVPEREQYPIMMPDADSPSPDNKNAEIQLLKEQVKMIQQQHQYQIQMIHYLQLQMSMLTQQRQQSEEPKSHTPLAQPGGQAFNPLTQMLANTNNGNAVNNLASSVASALSTKFPHAREDFTSKVHQSSISPPSTQSINAVDFARQHPGLAEGSAPFDQSELMMRALHQQKMQQNSFLMAQQQARQTGLIPEQVSAMLQAQAGMPSRFDEATRAHQLKEQRQPEVASFVSKSPPTQNPFAPISTNKLQRLVDNIGDDQTLVKNQCKTCRRVLSCPSALKLHYRTHTGERPYQCDLCSRAFTTRGNLRTHYSSVHRRELPPANVSNNCTTLARRNQAPNPASQPANAYDEHLAMAQHMRLQTLANRQQQHLLALQQQQQQQQIKSDVSSMNSSPTNATKLSVGDAVDLSAYGRRSSEHTRSPDSSRDVNIKEEILDSHDSYRVKSSPVATETKKNDAAQKDSFNALDLSGASPQMKENENKARQQISPKNCCSPKSFNEEYASSMHQITPLKRIEEAPEELNNSSPAFSCDLCPAKFDLDEELADHLLRHENSLCDSPKSNNSASSYSGYPRDGANGQQRTSMKRTYEDGIMNGEPDFKRNNLRHWCDICKKQFSSASSLQIHNRTHTGEKPFSCNVCGRAFTTKGNLKVHMGTHVWGAGGSRKGRRVSIDNPVMSTWMKNSTNVDAMAARNGNQQQAPVAPPNASSATAAIYQQYAALAQGLMNRNQEPGQLRYPANPMMNLNPAALAASRFLQQQQLQEPGNTSTEASPEGRTETSLSSDGENDQPEASSNNPSAAVAHEWLWKMYQQRSQGQVN